ncbi:MAG: hypothetical protein FH753_16785 [Firmicutes bacterium]|nr:hypothetical protein [Bacillota bacterium]
MANMKYIPIYLIFIPIITSMIIYLFNNKYVNYLVFLSQGVITYFSIKYFSLNNHFLESNILNLGGWEKAIGISLKNDRLSMAFIFLSIFIWWVILLYSWNNRKGDFKFLFFLLFLEGAFLGLLQTNDLFNLFIFIEITTIISTILIIYKKDGYSVKSGLYYLLFNSTGMIFYLLGLILVYTVTGTLNMDIAKERIELLNNTLIIKLAFVFIMASIGVKSAFFPVYNWLPKAHGAAPASISALLSGLLIKSGIYAYIRLHYIFNINDLNDLFFILGILTALSGIIFALSQKDIKQVLAFHTISQIGIILMGLSSYETKANIGGLLHVFNHALFKSLLFLGSGIIINHYNTRKITEIRGVFKRLPVVSVIMIIGMFSITGAPFFNGFVSKTIIKYGIKHNSFHSILFFIINLGTCISFIKFSQIFFGDFKKTDFKKIHSRSSMIILGISCLLMGILYAPIINVFYDIDLSFVNIFSLSALFNYLISLVIGFFIFKFIIDKDFYPMKKIRHLYISFETTNFMLISFIIIMTIISLR